jgi:hypothetical protein
MEGPAKAGLSYFFLEYLYHMNIFEEILWSQFVQFEHIKPLPLNEQVNQYNQYLFELSIARQNWLAYQNKGPLTPITRSVPIESGFLLQEDLDFLFQENGDNIIITSLS